MGTNALCRWVMVLVALAGMTVLTGCDPGTQAVKLVNESTYPITEVLIYKTPASGEQPGTDALINRLSTDGDGVSVALPGDNSELLPWLFENRVYTVAITFYDKAGVFRQITAANPLDLRGLHRSSLVIMRAGLDSSNQGYVTYETLEDD